MRGALALVVIAVVIVGDHLHTIDDHWLVEGPSREGTAIPFGVCPCSGDCAYIAHHFGPIYARRYPALSGLSEASRRAARPLEGYSRTRDVEDTSSDDGPEFAATPGVARGGRWPPAPPSLPPAKSGAGGVSCVCV